MKSTPILMSFALLSLLALASCKQGAAPTGTADSSPLPSNPIEQSGDPVTDPSQGTTGNGSTDTGDTEGKDTSAVPPSEGSGSEGGAQSAGCLFDAGSEGKVCYTDMSESQCTMVKETMKAMDSLITMQSIENVEMPSLSLEVSYKKACPANPAETCKTTEQGAFLVYGKLTCEEAKSMGE